MSTDHFAFGKNWESFVANYLTPDRIEEARKSLSDFCKMPNFKGKSFVDVGCGSGLFSMVAHQLGASPVISFDIDKNSVHCCEMLKKQAGNPSDWTVLEGSILDETFWRRLQKFDIVYSWGVLHHTGSMWKAIENCIHLMKEGGLFYLAIYNKADGLAIYPDMRVGPSSFWKFEKCIYSRLPWVVQNIIDYSLMLILVLAYVLTLHNPIKKIKGHKQLRGMSWRIDIKDWLGGWPYEFANVAEVFKFMHDRGLSLENLKSNNGLLNNEYLFKK